MKSKISKYNIIGDTHEDTRLLQKMADESLEYITSYEWCPEIKSINLAYGIGGVVGVFLIDLSEAIDGDVTSLWTITGDLPPAYLVMAKETKPLDVLDTYCDLMMEWVDAVKSGKDVSNLYPVRSNPTMEMAERLETRIRFLREHIIDPSLPPQPSTR